MYPNVNTNTNKKALAFVIAGLLSALLVLPSIPVGRADETQCTGGFGKAIHSGTYGNVVVPAGGACFIWGSPTVTVTMNNLAVEKGGELHIFGGVLVKGNLKATAPDHVVINPSRGGRNAIKGSVRVTDAVHVTTLLFLSVGKGVTIKGNGGNVSLLSDTIGGSLRIGPNKDKVNSTVDQNVIFGIFQYKGATGTLKPGTNLVAGTEDEQDQGDPQDSAAPLNRVAVNGHYSEDILSKVALDNGMCRYTYKADSSVTVGPC